MKIENVAIFNITGAIRGMRNPLNSWDKSDTSTQTAGLTRCHSDAKSCASCPYFNGMIEGCLPELGERDLALMRKLIKGGTEHRKFLRQILVSMDITSSLLFFKEFDTYKVGTTSNSCSTMHTLTKNPITLDSFCFDKDIAVMMNEQFLFDDYTKDIVGKCEFLRQLYLSTKNEFYWQLLIEILPSGWLQKRTWTANYEVLYNIYRQRKNHKLKEWRDFCEKIEKMPYFKELFLNS